MIEIPEKDYFKIGEVSRLLKVKAHVIRYWQSEFSSIRPFTTKTGHRLFRKKDVEMLALVQNLLHEHKYTVAGAKAHIKAMGTSQVKDAQPSTPTVNSTATRDLSNDQSIQVLKETREKLHEIYQQLIVDEI